MRNISYLLALGCLLSGCGGPANDAVDIGFLETGKPDFVIRSSSGATVSDEYFNLERPFATFGPALAKRLEQSGQWLLRRKRPGVIYYLRKSDAANHLELSLGIIPGKAILADSGVKTEPGTEATWTSVGRKTWRRQ